MRLLYMVMRDKRRILQENNSAEKTAHKKSNRITQPSRQQDAGNYGMEYKVNEEWILDAASKMN
mgnify:CR=1 FL=1